MIKCTIFKYILITFLCKALCYEFTIEVPKIKCDNVKKIEAGVTTIRLQGKDAQSLKYEWEVNFNVTDNCTSQRCNLMVWRSVQDLYRSLNYINKSSEIKINNTILISTVRYKLNCTIKMNETVVESKEYILECGSSNSTNASVLVPPPEKLPTHTFVKLLGSNITYPDMLYVINAEVVNFDSSSYYFNWKILDNFEGLVKTYATKGSTLSFPSNSLITGQQYFIMCSVIDSQNAASIAMTTQDVTVLSRGMILNLPVTKLHVGLDRAFKLNAYLEDPDNTKEDIYIEWFCFNNKQENCNNFNSQNSTSIENIKFLTTGSYNVKIIAKKGNSQVEDSCEIQVVESGYVSIEVDDIVTPIDPTKDIVIPVYVSFLRTGCSLQWSSLNLPEYGFISLDKAPGKINVMTNITIMEDEFLSEIDEYSNETVDREYNLLLSKPTGFWSGLHGNTSYMFRLNVTCPVDDDDDELDNSPEVLLKLVTLTADISVRTDPLPLIKNMHVSPSEGVALKTLFNFSVSNVVYDKTESPILYKFGYLINNQTIFISNEIEGKTCKSVLPYMDKGVPTILECCNSFSLCSRITGPKITTRISTFSEEEQNNFLSEINQLIDREEYYKTFSRTTEILLTYEGLKNKELLNDFEKNISNLIIFETKRLLKLSNEDNENWKESGNNFIRDVGLILNQIQTSDELLNSILSLRNKLSKKQDSEMLSELNESGYSSRKLLGYTRQKREVGRMTLEEVKSYLVISELIITTSKDKKRVEQEKQQLLNQVDKFMVQLCSTLYEKPQSMNLDLKTVALALEKLNKNNMNRYFNLLRDATTWKVNGKIKLGKCFTDNLSFTNQLCIGKAIFKSYFNTDTYNYMVKVYGTRPNDQLKIQDMFCDAVLVLPIDKNVVGKDAKCAIWKDGWEQAQCRTLQTGSKNIQCQCRYLGYYAVEYNPITTTTLKTTTQRMEENEITKPTTLSTTIANYPEPTTPSKAITNSTDNCVTTSIKSTTINDFQSTSIPVANQTEPRVIERLAEFEYETLCYIIIGISIFGTITLLYGIKRILANPESKTKVDERFPKYEQLHNEELLDDLVDKPLSS